MSFVFTFVECTFKVYLHKIKIRTKNINSQISIMPKTNNLSMKRYVL